MRAGVLAGFLAMTAAAAETTVREFAVAPLTRYKLAFEADVKAESRAAWEVRIFNGEGLLPFEGVFSADWQRLAPGRKSYSHEFLTPRDGALLKLVIVSEGVSPVLGAIELFPITNGNPVVNGDFAAGPGNFSGWNTRRLARMETNAEGRLVLRCDPQGYILTDPIPVEPGATYRYTEGSTPGRVLVYDIDLLRTDSIDTYNEKTNPVLKMPSDAAFIRIDYCDGREYRTPLIRRVGLELIAKGPVTEATRLEAYPGEIVLAPDAALPEIRAAREIQHWVRRISGKEMRVLAAASDREQMKLFVGRHWAEPLFPGDLKTLEGSDGFAVRQKGRNIYLFGARPAGALFGAMRFLEKNTDLIWARPEKEFGALFSVNPKLEFKEADFMLRPAFSKRMTGSYYAQSAEAGIWQGRAGFNTGAHYYNQFEREEMGGAPTFDGNFMSVMAQSDRYAFEKCAKEHPEFFALVNGQRQIQPGGYICYTAPGIAEAIAAGLCRVMDAAAARGEKLEHISVRTRDGWTVCSCAECMKPIPLPDGRLLKPKGDTAQSDPLFFSTRMTLMMNKVAAEFAKAHPDTSIGVLAYLYMSVPPAVKHAANLIPSFCAYDTCSLRFPILDGKDNHIIYGDSGGRAWEERFREYLNRNAGENRKLSQFAYYYCNGFAAVADSAGADWSAMVKSGGVHGILMDGFTEGKGDEFSMWDYQALERWIMARLMWEPTLDPQALREYYIQRAYGKAAPEMLEFYNTIRKAWKDPEIKFGPNCHTPSADLFDTLIVKTGNEKKLRDLLVEAAKKADKPESRILVERTVLAFDRFAGSMKRIYIPYVPESTDEWSAAGSTFWMQGVKLGEFKRVSTWEDFKQVPARHPTQVSVMRDRENLYIRFEAAKAEKRDQVELVLTAERRATQYFFALDPAGKRYDMKNSAPWDSRDWKGAVVADPDGYTAIFKIPLSLIKEMDMTKEDLQLYAKFSRLSMEDNDREESSLTGTSITRTHYMNYWTALSIARGGDRP